jgi:hypothetical protein
VILETTDTLAIVDSEIQLSRDQMIRGKRTSIRSIVKQSNRVTAFSVDEFEKARKIWDRGFCINVLSVVPHHSARRRILHLIRSKLRSGGTCLFVVQYRNSDFERMKRLPNARPWRDGFIIDSLRGFSFYGLISPDRLEALILNAGFEVAKRTLHEGSAYIVAKSVA